MTILKLPICWVKGHDVNPEESIVADIMPDRRNWLCQCHRCGLYVMNDGAISGMKITITEEEAVAFRFRFLLLRNFCGADMRGEQDGH